jgi:predicted HicB family RNase H-like nuclease
MMTDWKQFCLLLSPATLKNIQKLAKRSEMSVSHWIREAIKEKLKR